jgi:hypothetical protein
MKSIPATGYSGTPLAKKFGIKVAHRVFLVDAPKEYQALLGPLAQGVQFLGRADASVDVAHVFATRREDLSKHLVALWQTRPANAALWISWPKKASKLPTTVTQDSIRELALPLGFVDVKVCAITEVWPGLKLVVRKELR